MQGGEVKLLSPPCSADGNVTQVCVWNQRDWSPSPSLLVRFK